MAHLDRRTLLKAAALGGAAAVTGAPRVLAQGKEDAPGQVKKQPNDPTCEGASPDWSVPPSTLPGNADDCPIEHIGVLMMENRTYDTYFGWLENGRGFLNLGLDLTYTDPLTGETGSPTHWAPAYRRCDPHPDPAHGWDSGRDQLQNGFLAGRNDEYALAYYLAEDIPTYARLARQFTVFDRYFCAILSSTYPNRHYQHSATGGGHKSNVFPPQVGAPTGYTWPTIWDRLDAAGLSSAYYFSDLPFIAMYGARHLNKMRPISQFFVDAAAGRLPNVYFVDPVFLGEHRTDDHPGGADMNTAQAFVNNISHAIITGPQWARSAFFINYDEWGGFFDHVVPPRTDDDDLANASNPNEDWGQRGFRVPAIAISPYSRKGYVHHDGPYDHTSILKFIEWRWGLEPLTKRDAAAKNIGDAFDYSQSPRTQIKIRQMETPTVFFSSGCDTAPAAPNDFEAFAESSFLRSLGVEVGRPSLSEVFGSPATSVPKTAPVGGLLRR